jgi:hypothetical protein
MRFNGTVVRLFWEENMYLYAKAHLIRKKKGNLGIMSFYRDIKRSYVKNSSGSCL